MKILDVELDKVKDPSESTKFVVKGTIRGDKRDRLKSSGIELKDFEKKLYDYRRLNDIVDIVSQYFRVDREGMFVMTKGGKYVKARALCFHFFNEYNECGYSFGEFANFFGLKTHANVLHHLKNVRDEMKVNRAYRFDVEQIDSLIKKYKIV